MLRSFGATISFTMLCRLVIVSLCAVGAVGAIARAQELGAVPAHVTDFLAAHCVECHGGDRVKAKLDLRKPPSSKAAKLWRWSHLRQRVHSFEMPPLDADEVGVAEREAFVRWVDGLLEREVPRLAVDPGQVTVRRLSRGQWRNTVRDVLGVQGDASAFPTDDLGYGFDSIGDALTFSTLHLEKYLAASRQVAALVFHGEDAEHPERRDFEAGSMRLVNDRGASMRGYSANLYSNATIEQLVELPREGLYRVHIVASATQAGDEPAKMLPQLDGKRLDVIEVANTQAVTFAFEMRMLAGRRRIALSFINDYYDPKNPDASRRDRNLRIDSLTVVGPLDARDVPVAQRWLWSAQHGSTDVARLRSMVRGMLPKLWRRPVLAAERKRFQRAGIARLKAGESLNQAQRFVLTAALTSPHFLFRIEQKGRSPEPEALGGSELATRLSYFLWASAPDAKLQALGQRLQLRDTDVLASQVDRMLRDPRADSLSTEFAAQWFELRSLDETHPDPDLFPAFDDGLRGALARETELLFLAVLREGRDVRELLDCDFTHLNARLAKFYGVPHVGDPDVFVRTELVGDARLRGGLLGHASMQVITSNPTRTSPVKRGKWILDNLLGQAPPPPPPGNVFANESAIDSSASLREQLAQHRERSRCAVCHVRMDALGFAMERFDAIGRFRSTDSAGTIDASGELPDGRKVDGLSSLKAVLIEDPAFVRTMARKLFVYAIGRDLRPVDRLRLDFAVRQLVVGGKVTVRDLILLVVHDPAFGMRVKPD